MVGIVCPWKVCIWPAVASGPFPLLLPFLFPERDMFPNTAPLEGDKITMKERAGWALCCGLPSTPPKLTTSPQNANCPYQGSHGHNSEHAYFGRRGFSASPVTVVGPKVARRRLWMERKGRQKNKESDVRKNKRSNPELNLAKNKEKEKRKMVSIRGGKRPVLFTSRAAVGCAVESADWLSHN